ncbi:ATP-dependent DNA helicase [Microvirga pakistanensis]|uniref:ATP-dependent DNA helicase n=1 Tax=Microvirga pakistanensis TaxID=1682650 RepID=UPI00106BC011|nr:ATP-dependent RecD-like DNA helicase [Microvirga pakistanensis]
MPTHITARLAWHDDGWNGRVCRKPERNTYCIGSKSYPGDVIANQRQLDLEMTHAGCRGKVLEGGYVPPCCYSYNAFGLEEVPAASDPPDFFYGGATRLDWTLPGATVCVWPYEAMYSDEVRADGYLDNDKRRELTLDYFAPIERGESGKSLIFYYANFSNPLSEEEAPRYVLVGVSRIAAVGEELRYENVTPEIAERYAGGMVWARNVTSHYPNEGLRLPYHLYRDNPEILADIAVFPENPLLCQYGSKHLTDDLAIGLLEQFLAKVRHLKEIGDTSESWDIREAWLLKTIAELWTHRGLYPGLLRALDAAGAGALIDGAKAVCEQEGDVVAHRLAFDVLDRKANNAVSAGLDEQTRRKLSRNWQLLEEDGRALLRDVLPRFDFSAEVMSAIVSDQRADYGISASPAEIAANPYLLSEQYCGDSPDDRIPWSAIDRGVLPSPDLGGEPLAGVDTNDERRFRGLCVEHLRRETKHTFRLSKDVLAEIMERMERLPGWKRAIFNERYFTVDAEFLSAALTLVPREAGLTIYLKSVYEDERLVESVVRDLSTRPDITLRRPVTTADWTTWIQKTGSPLAQRAPKEYADAIVEQAATCAQLFSRPLSAVTGAAGTGKTTVIEALIRAVRRTEGEGADVLVLAPTGKATDRVREVFEKAGLKGIRTVTVHSFLATNGWLNDNLTFKRAGGTRSNISTLVLDETSMLDLELAAALFRAIDWATVRRLILVGDPGQLPPIGRGRVFFDILEWLRSEQPESFGRLKRNMRQLVNRVQGQGEAIVRLSELFIVDPEDKSLLDDTTDASTRLDQEELIERIHAGGAVDHDLTVEYWNDPQDLSRLLIDAVERKMSGSAADPDTPAYQIWRSALESDPTAYQVLTPHRGELHGVEALNQAIQKRIASNVIERVGAVDGITVFDKVIQIRNRPKSNPIWAYDWTAREQVKVEVFNGEIGVVETFGFDNKVLNRLRTGYGPRLKRFAVRFTRKPDLAIGYGKSVPAGKGSSGKPRYRNEPVEDNLELAYAVSVHKAQGSEFAHTFVIIPAAAGRGLSPELVYTALTRASRHCTLLIERDVSSLLNARRRENAQTPQINSSLFEFHMARPELLRRRSWYEAGKIHEALSGDMLRSKSEVIIANLLHQSGIPFRYEEPLLAKDGTIRLPDFTITWRGETFFWEHLGLLDQTAYAEDWKRKRAWYERWFPGRLLTTQEGSHLSRQVEDLIQRITENEVMEPDEPVI